MKKVHYNKLIRDKVPANMDAKGVAYEVCELGDDEFRLELRKKVGEEASALPGIPSRDELIGEIADVQDAIDELCRVEGINREEVAAAQAGNAERKGGFLKRIFLLWSADDGYETNERHG